jgi:hypothetical protein
MTARSMWSSFLVRFAVIGVQTATGGSSRRECGPGAWPTSRVSVFPLPSFTCAAVAIKCLPLKAMAVPVP